jgi:hypothetical protein
MCFTPQMHKTLIFFETAASTMQHNHVRLATENDDWYCILRSKRGSKEAQHREIIFETISTLPNVLA